MKNGLPETPREWLQKLSEYGRQNWKREFQKRIDKPVEGDQTTADTYRSYISIIDELATANPT